MPPTYGPNNNPNQEVVVDVDADADAEPMIPTQTSLLNDGDRGEEIIDNNTTATLSSDICPQGRHRDGNEDALVEDEDALVEDEDEDALVEDEDAHCDRCKKEEERQCFLKTDELRNATLKGDWKTAQSIFDSDPSAVTMDIGGDTPLYIAILTKQTAFVEKLVKLISSEDLTPTALGLAAGSGELRIAEVLVEKNPDLPNIYIPEEPSLIPVCIAVISQSKDIAYFLFSKTIFEALQLSHQTSLLLMTIANDYYDLALQILKKNPQLAKERLEKSNQTALHFLATKAEAIGSSGKLSFWKRCLNYDMALQILETNPQLAKERERYKNMTALHYLATKADAIGSSGKLSFWKRCINYGFKGLYNKDLMQTLAHQLVQNIWNDVIKDFTKEEVLEFINTPSSLLDDAARVGNVEFLIILINSYPYLMISASSLIGERNIFHTAIKNRQESVFSLIYETGFIMTDWQMLELAGKIADPNDLNRIPGAALQMQRELSWFKEVEKMVPPFFHDIKLIKTDDKVEWLTPRQLFTKEHKQLLKDGEEWMTKTANSCMLVATLIATVVFAAAFTVPGGIDNNIGTAIFRHKDSFTIFIISDVTALVLSTTSILIFLSILTSRYTEDDFLVSLPRKLLFGMVTLFFSIVCMIVAFSATIFMVYDKVKSEILLAIIVGAIIPVCCFCRLHSKLVLDILRSTGWFGFSFRFRKRRLVGHLVQYLETNIAS